MDKTQIAHDLAVAKLYGSELSATEIVAQYRQYYEEFLAILNSESRQVRTAKIAKSPI